MKQSNQYFILFFCLADQFTHMCTDMHIGQIQMDFRFGLHQVFVATITSQLVNTARIKLISVNWETFKTIHIPDFLWRQIVSCKNSYFSLQKYKTYYRSHGFKKIACVTPVTALELDVLVERSQFYEWELCHLLAIGTAILIL